MLNYIIFNRMGERKSELVFEPEMVTHHSGCLDAFKSSRVKICILGSKFICVNTMTLPVSLCL